MQNNLSSLYRHTNKLSAYLKCFYSDGRIMREPNALVYITVLATSCDTYRITMCSGLTRADFSMLCLPTIITMIICPFLEHKINCTQLCSWRFKQIYLHHSSGKRNGCRAKVCWQTVPHKRTGDHKAESWLLERDIDCQQTKGVVYLLQLSSARYGGAIFASVCFGMHPHAHQ